MQRLIQILEAQLGNMVMQIAHLTVALEERTAERDAALKERDELKDRANLRATE
jgi:hypothetical protein